MSSWWRHDTTWTPEDMGQYVLSRRDDMATCHQNMTCLRWRGHRDPILKMSRQGHVQLRKGLEAAAELDLASSGLADVISNNCHSQRHSCSREMLHAALASCWSSSITIPFLPKGRRLYHKSTQQYFDMTIDEFAEAVAENNWMVRFLTGKRSGTLSWHDLETAKEVFGRKCLVGLADRAEESFRRYKQFFRWDQNVPKNA